MSKYIKTIPLANVERIAVVLGEGRLVSQVKKDTGCNLCMNAGFYGGDGKPTHHLKADGKVLARSPWGCWGFSWNQGGDIRMEVMPDESKRSYIAGVELLSPMVSETGEIPYDRKGELGGIRGRTAIAHTGDKLILYCSGDSTKDAATLEEVQEELRRLGAESAVYVDGGGSSQCDFGSGKTIYSDRAVYSFLCVWLKKKEDKPVGRKFKVCICVWLKKKEDKPVGRKFKVCIDRGHDTGVGNGSPDGSYKEYEFAWDMGGCIKAHLERCGVEVVDTRGAVSEVKSLTARANVSNAAGCDVFLSTHTNAPGAGSIGNDGWCESVRGLLVFTSKADANAGRNKLAGCILERMKAAGVRICGSGLQHYGYTVLTKTNAPADIIEFGFHTNRADVALLKDSAYRAKLAEAAAKGVCDYLGAGWVSESVKEPEKPTDEPWYAKDQAWVKEMGINSTTRPESFCTRAEAWTMMHNLYKAIKAGK